jgi:hypothetical protein
MLELLPNYLSPALSQICLPDCSQIPPKVENAIFNQLKWIEID